MPASCGSIARRAAPGPAFWSARGPVPVRADASRLIQRRHSRVSDDGPTLARAAAIATFRRRVQTEPFVEPDEQEPGRP